MSDQFECFQLTRERYSDDFKKWPERHRAASDAAIKRLLDENPGAKVIAEEAFCISHENSIFPDLTPPMVEGQTAWFGLLRRVYLDRDVQDKKAA